MNLGMTEQGLQDIFRRNTTTLSTVEKLSAFFGVPVGYFFDETVAIGAQVANGQSVAIAAHGNSVSVEGGVLIHAPKTGAESSNEIELLRQKIEGLEKELEAKDKLIALYERMGK